ncbi:hypothetical protein R5R35_014533 [Gryllus longicercus]|uniref:Uncharacterized protein n=1 Tax=Gryllus longicercus TaxID=2509291 RepID=A0AAN9YX42_9ORTH
MLFQRCNNTLHKIFSNLRIAYLRNINTEEKTKKWESSLDFCNSCDEQCREQVVENMIILNDFLSLEEEKSLFEEVEPYMKKLHYEFDHWDDAIHGYRETERLQWNEKNKVIIDKVRSVGFPASVPQLKLVHVLDLAENGVIKAHIDSTRFCGNTIAGLSLLSDSVMRLVHHEKKDLKVDALLRRRSLYIMKGVVRYNFTHEILGNDVSLFRGCPVLKTRRLSIICRNEPVS